MTFQTAVESWLSKRVPYHENDRVVSFEISHSESWMSDSGTGWPAETTLDVTWEVTRPGKRPKLERGSIDIDTLTFAREVFEIGVDQ